MLLRPPSVLAAGRQCVSSPASAPHCHMRHGGRLVSMHGCLLRGTSLSKPHRPGPRPPVVANPVPAHACSSPGSPLPSPPVPVSVARTCPRLAAAMGCSLSSMYTSEIGRPRSSSISCHVAGSHSAGAVAMRKVGKRGEGRGAGGSVIARFSSIARVALQLQLQLLLGGGSCTATHTAKCARAQLRTAPHPTSQLARSEPLTAYAISLGKGGSLSCSSESDSRYTWGSRSGRADRACPILTNEGLVVGGWCLVGREGGESLGRVGAASEKERRQTEP